MNHYLLFVTRLLGLYAFTSQVASLRSYGSYTSSNWSKVLVFHIFLIFFGNFGWGIFVFCFYLFISNYFFIINNIIMQLLLSLRSYYFYMIILVIDSLSTIMQQLLLFLFSWQLGYYLRFLYVSLLFVLLSCRCYRFLDCVLLFV